MFGGGGQWSSEARYVFWRSCLCVSLEVRFMWNVLIICVRWWSWFYYAGIVGVVAPARIVWVLCGWFLCCYIRLTVVFRCVLSRCRSIMYSTIAMVCFLVLSSWVGSRYYLISGIAICDSSCYSITYKINFDFWCTHLLYTFAGSRYTVRLWYIDVHLWDVVYQVFVFTHREMVGLRCTHFGCAWKNN
jgi:hypothetical protein